MTKTKLIIIGGFLGAGKTTLLHTAARLLEKEGKTVGLITNDQAKGLVDTHILSNNGISVQEIAGSCFCCDFDGLMEAALFLRDTAKCDTILAEPVGSCTDLSATLVQPIKSYYKQYFELTPLSVLIDPIRLKETLATDDNTKEGSGYIYLKQLEEADYLVVNKTDLLSADEQLDLRVFIESKFPNYSLKWISALQEEGIQEWLKTLYTDTKVGTRIAEVDYDIYAEGEARMGWYNADFTVTHTHKYLIPWAELNLKFLELLQQVFQHEKIAIGHLKTFIKSGPSKLHANLTGTDRALSVQGMPFSSHSAHLIVNIRAEANSKLLKGIMEDIIEVYREENIHFEAIALNHLTPGRPEPTHRFTKTD